MIELLSLYQYNDQSWSELWDDTSLPEASHLIVRNETCRDSDERQFETEVHIFSSNNVDVTDYFSHTICNESGLSSLDLF